MTAEAFGLRKGEIGHGNGVAICRAIPRCSARVARTGRGGQQLAKLEPDYQLMALDCVQSRLDVLPKCYGRAICALSTMWAT